MQKSTLFASAGDATSLSYRVAAHRTDPASVRLLNKIGMAVGYQPTAVLSRIAFTCKARIGIGLIEEHTNASQDP